MLPSPPVEKKNKDYILAVSEAAIKTMSFETLLGQTVCALYRYLSICRGVMGSLFADWCLRCCGHTGLESAPICVTSRQPEEALIEVRDK